MDSKQIHWARVWTEASTYALFEKISSRVNPVLLNLRRILGSYGCTTIVEAGCGDGYVIRSIGKELRGTVFVGIDYSREGIRRAKRKCISADASFILGDVRNLPLRPYSADVVTSFGVIEHFGIAGSSKTIHEAYAALKPSGFLFVETPNRSTFGLSEKMAKSLSEYFGSHAFYTSNELADLVGRILLKESVIGGQIVFCQSAGFAQAIVWSLTNQSKKYSIPFSFLAYYSFLVVLPLSVFFKKHGLFSQLIVRKC
jgi:SAM-dependent methyltransferase